MLQLPHRAALIVLILLCGCRTQPQDALLKSELRISLDNMPATLDWNKYEDSTSRIVILQLMCGLFTRMNRHAEIAPDHAADYQVTENGTKISIELKKGILWSDGVELQAKHYYDSWIRTLNPLTNSARAQHFYPIQGAEEWNRLQKGSAETVGIQVTGPYSLEVKLKRRNVYFKSLLANPYAFPIRMDLISKYGDQWTHPSHLVTLGPFRLREWKINDRITLEPFMRNHVGPPKLKQITFLIIPETASSLTLFDVGKLDILPTISPLEIPQRKSSSSFVAIPQVSTYYLGFSLKGATANPKVRQALALAIDEKELVEATHAPHRPQKSFLPAVIRESNLNIGLPFQPDHARQLLKEAGYPEGRKLPSLKYSFNSHPLHRMVGENIQAQLKRNLKVDIILESLDWKNYLKALKENLTDLWRMGWSADSSAHDFMMIWKSDSEFNIPRWKNLLYDTLIDQALLEVDLPKRRAIYDRAQRLLLEENAVIVPLFHTVLSCLVKPYVKDLVVNALGDIGLHEARIDTSQLSL